MPILTHVGRRHPTQIALRVGIYVFLTLGALGIVLPLLIVIGQTMSNEYDLRDNVVVPYYLRDPNELVLKHIFSYTKKLGLLASRHNRNEWGSQVGMRTDEGFFETRADVIESQGYSLEGWRQILSDWNDFKESLDAERLMVKEFRVEDHYRPFLRERYNAKADAESWKELLALLQTVFSKSTP